MAKVQSHTDELGSLKISKLLTKLSIPATIGMMVIVFYNVVDTIFVARYVGTMAIGGLAIVMPITMLISAVGMALGVGGSSLISRFLGAGRVDDANTVFGNLLMLTLTLSVGFTAIGYIFPDYLLQLFGAKGEILPFAKKYYMIVLAGTPFIGMSMAANNIIRSEGNARMSMMLMLVSSMINLILDYVLIITFDYGIEGAAWATFISQVLTFVFVVYYFVFSGKSSVSVKMHNLKLEVEFVKELLGIGSSSFARQGATSILAIIINHSLMAFGNEVDVAIYGVMNRIQFMAIFPLIGLVQGFLPVLGYNYGAKNIDRIKETMKLSFITSVVIGIVSWVVMFGFPDAVFSIFTDDIRLIENGGKYLRILAVFLPVIGIQMLGASYFQAVGEAKPALLLTLARQIIFLLPLIFILPNFLGLIGIWIAFPIADALSTVYTVFYLKPRYSRMLRTLEVGNPDFAKPSQG